MERNKITLLKDCPIELVYTHEFYNPIEAIRAEKQIKGWVTKEKTLINGDFQLPHNYLNVKMRFTTKTTKKID
ncbi:hypothetical protein ABRY23_09295 [Melioribacteraceae bacterium 4301-Me]|uniref:hypothetical protein n=1 Tax=Pyranulibacter aquaticus TaxID=3163344 RepID=UPI003598CFF2